MAKSTYDEYIGIPFAYHGRGPDSYDCFGFLMEMYRKYRGVELPDYTSSDEIERIAKLVAAGLEDWTPVPEQPHVAVLMRVSGYGAHVGFTVGNGMFVHTWEGSKGVVLEHLDTWKHRIMGFYDYV